MSNKSSKFHFIIDFGEDLTLEEAEQYFEKALAGQVLFSPLEKMKIEDVGIAMDRVLEVYLAQKEFELLHKRVKYEETYLGVLVRKIIQKSLNEWEKEAFEK
jgi:hypothetical protein